MSEFICPMGHTLNPDGSCGESCSKVCWDEPEPEDEKPDEPDE